MYQPYPTGAQLLEVEKPTVPAQVKRAVAGLVKAWWPVIWLAGLIAVIFLWRRPSTEFFKGVWR